LLFKLILLLYCIYCKDKIAAAAKNTQISLKVNTLITPMSMVSIDRILAIT
jgi:hypothetical protein